MQILTGEVYEGLDPFYRTTIQVVVLAVYKDLEAKPKISIQQLNIKSRQANYPVKAVRPRYICGWKLIGRYYEK